MEENEGIPDQGQGAKVEVTVEVEAKVGVEA